MNNRSKKQRNWKKLAGVTLLELLVTMSVLLILFTVAVPQLGVLVAHNTRTTEVNTLIGHLNFARMEAINRAGPVSLCPVTYSDPNTCSDTSWTDGYAVVDEALNEALRYQQASKGVDINPTSNFASRAVFQDDGSVRGAAGGSFSLCTIEGSVKPRRVVVSGMGAFYSATMQTAKQQRKRWQRLA